LSIVDGGCLFHSGWWTKCLSHSKLVARYHPDFRADFQHIWLLMPMYIVAFIIVLCIYLFSCKAASLFE